MAEFRGMKINPELPVVLIITILLIGGGIAFVYFVNFSNFNFYSSKLTISGLNVQEELHYKPDKPYHTLYRNFVSNVYSEYTNQTGPNSVIIQDVQCSSGDAYMRDYNGRCYNSTGVLQC